MGPSVLQAPVAQTPLSFGGSEAEEHDPGPSQCKPHEVNRSHVGRSTTANVWEALAVLTRVSVHALVTGPSPIHGEAWVLAELPDPLVQPLEPSADRVPAHDQEPRRVPWKKGVARVIRSPTPSPHNSTKGLDLWTSDRC